jgi:hypothetical protein
MRCLGDIDETDLGALPAKLFNQACANAASATCNEDAARLETWVNSR